MNPTPRTRSRSGRHLASPPMLWMGGTALLAIMVLFAVAASNTGSTGTTELAETGAYSTMGVPVVELPGSASGTATAGAVVVTGADWALGTVPLDVAVRPYWLLRNTGNEPVTIGQPRALVNEGCCPGPFGIDTTTIEPGEEAVLTFELAMHPGMDGWHDMDVHVPVTTSSGQEALTLNVTGDFRS